MRYPDNRAKYKWDFHIMDLTYSQMRDVKDVIDEYMEKHAPEADYKFEAVKTRLTVEEQAEAIINKK
jgi:hypothetical protein